MEFDGGNEGNRPPIGRRKLRKFIEKMDELEEQISEVTSQEPESIETVRERLLEDDT